MAKPADFIAVPDTFREPAAAAESAPAPGPAPRLPSWFLWSVAGVCALPLALNALGVRFDLPVDEAAVLASDDLDGTIRRLAGTYVHSLLEWAATVVAIVTAVLAFAHYLIARDVVTPIIGFALLTAGLVDAFHVLAADRLIQATADNREFIPFTWAVSRTFNAVIPLIALALLAFAGHLEPGRKPGRPVVVIALATTLIAAVAYGLIQYCATSERLPQTLFPGALVSRPWDVYPLVIYAISGLMIYPLFRRRIHSLFALALWLSVVPDVATQLYMAFGSAALFDNYFNIAHFLKIVAYLVPCAGLLCDYVATYRRVDELQLAVARRAEELARSNADLEQFAYAASHDLRSPLRVVGNLSRFIEEDLEQGMAVNAKANMQLLRGRLQRLDTLLDDLLKYARVGRNAGDPVEVDTGRLVRDVVELLHVPGGLEISVAEDLPVLSTERTPLELVFRNLIGNAIKHRDRDTSRIAVTGRATGSGVEFSVSDDGPGIPPLYHDRIFGMFQSLQSGSSGESSGMGLAMVKRSLELRGGDIHVYSRDGERGTTFTFTWPATSPGVRDGA